MRLLLLLSAILSALTGAGGTARGVQAQAVVAQETVRGLPAQVAARTALSVRPLVPRATLRSVSVVVPIGRAPVAPAVALYASRRRE